LIVVRPTDRHLAQLRDQVPAMVAVDPAKEHRLHQALSPYFDATGTEQVEYSAALSSQQAQDLLDMSPTARHLDRATAPSRPSPGTVTISVLITEYRPR
jgi:23S rRNA (guanine745-N1)-methyltransferase